jgi:hypothetical protein
MTASLKWQEYLEEICKSQAKIRTLRPSPHNFNEISVYDSLIAIWKMRKIRKDCRQNWLSLSQEMTKMDTIGKNSEIA